MNKKETIAHYKEMLASDDFWAIRGLLAIHRNQTYNERVLGVTVERNNVGFSGADANILSSFADQVIRRIHDGRIPKNVLTERQLAIVRKKMPKYAGQLFHLGNNNKTENTNV